MIEYEPAILEEKEESPFLRHQLLSLFKESLEDYQSPSITLHSEKEDHKVITGAELWQRGLEYAEGLKNLGIRPGDRILCILESGADFAALFIACLHVEATFCPSSNYNEDRDVLQRRIRAIDPRLIISNSFSDFTSPYRIEISYLSQLEHTLLRETKRLSSEKLSIILWTGTVHIDRAIGIKEKNLLHQVHALKNILSIKEGEKICAYLSWFHSYGLIMEMLLCLLNRGNLIVYYPKKYDDSLFLNFIHQYPNSYLFASSGILQTLFLDPRGIEYLKLSKGGVISGAALSISDCETLKSLNSNFRQGYHITEASSLVCVGEKGAYAPDFMGKSIACQMKIGPTGTLMVKGASVTDIVWFGPPQNFEDDWLDTGDIVEQYSDGSYTFQGRIHRTWKWSNGETYNPYPFEKDLMERSGAEVVVFKGNKDTHCIVVVSPEQSVLDVFTESERKNMIWIHPTEVEDCRMSLNRWSYQKLAHHVMNHYLSDVLDEDLYSERATETHIGHKLRMTLSQFFNYLEDNQCRLIFSADTDWAVSRANNFANRKYFHGEFIEGWNTPLHPLLNPLISYSLKKGEPFLSHQVVLSIMIGKLQPLLQGKSAISKVCCDWFSEACKMRLTPYIPLDRKKELSSSMLYALAAWSGQGYFITEKNEIFKSKEYLKKHHLQPIPLKGRDAISILAGASIEVGITSAFFNEYTKIFASMISLISLLYDCFEVDIQKLQKYYGVNTYSGNIKITDLLKVPKVNQENSCEIKPNEQEEFFYSLSQILGAILTHLTPQMKILEDELNGVCDSTVFDVSSDRILEGGSIFGQYVYLINHQIRPLCVQIKDLMDQLIDFLNPDLPCCLLNLENPSLLNIESLPLITVIPENSNSTQPSSWTIYEYCKSLQPWVGAILISLKKYMTEKDHGLVKAPYNEYYVFISQLQNKKSQELTLKDLEEVYLSFLSLNSSSILRKELLSYI